MVLTQRHLYKWSGTAATMRGLTMNAKYSCEIIFEQVWTAGSSKDESILFHPSHWSLNFEMLVDLENPLQNNVALRVPTHACEGQFLRGVCETTDLSYSVAHDGVQENVIKIWELI